MPKLPPVLATHDDYPAGRAYRVLATPNVFMITYAGETAILRYDPMWTNGMVYMPTTFTREHAARKMVERLNKLFETDLFGMTRLVPDK